MPTRSLASVIPGDDTDSAATAHDAGDDTATPDQANAPTKASTGAQQAAEPAEKESGSGTGRKRASNRSRNTGSTSTASEQRPGRPRIPKTGPVTRVTVDLAVTEQTQLETLAGKLGREIDRGRGKDKIYPQHLMRVAVRRLLTDADFRAAVTEDLAEHRDELKRPRK